MAITRENWLRSVVPAGTVIAFAGATPPSGWLLCDGSAISRSTYSALFAAISTAHGSGDGSTTFTLPDYRGRFLRGVDGSAGNDPDTASRIAMAAGGNIGDAVGSVQGHSFQTHNHTATAASDTHSHSIVGGTTGSAGNMQNSDCSANNNSGVTASDTHTHTITVATKAASGAKSQASANETRPINANVNYIIKA